MLDAATQRAIAAALGDAQEGTLGDLHLVTDDDPELDVDALALAQWRELGLDDVGVLIVVALGRREIRVVAGPRLLADAEGEFWQAAADRIAAGFRAGDPLHGVRQALVPIRALLLRVAPLPEVSADGG